MTRHTRADSIDMLAAVLGCAIGPMLAGLYGVVGTIPMGICAAWFVGRLAYSLTRRES